MDLLDWPAVCRQVACFASTPMAAEQLLQGGLPMGRAQVNQTQTLSASVTLAECPLQNDCKSSTSA
jgi:DNA mismatch repair protein MutS2